MTSDAARSMAARETGAGPAADGLVEGDDDARGCGRRGGRGGVGAQGEQGEDEDGGGYRDASDGVGHGG